MEPDVTPYERRRGMFGGIGQGGYAQYAGILMIDPSLISSTPSAARASAKL